MRDSLNPLRRTLLAGLVGAALVSTAAFAVTPRSYPPSVPYLKGNLVQVDVYNRTTGGALPIFPNAGRNWIEGVPGQEYGVRIRNCTGARVLVVTSVDGVNVISGDTAAPAQSGYVLEPYGSVEIQGWRKSLERTAAFYFTDLGDSYAARTGRPQNVGVIGVAVFQEKAKPRIAFEPWSERLRAQKDQAERRASSTADAAERADNGGTPLNAQARPAPAPKEEAPMAPPPPIWDGQPSALGKPAGEAGAAGGFAQRDAARAPLAEATRPASKLGTGHGRNEESRVTLTSFERATSSPAEMLSVQYDRRQNLVAMGVLPAPPGPIARRDPDPFPAMRFAPDPR